MIPESNEYQLGDAPVEADFKVVLNAFAKVLHESMPEAGFVLMMFPINSKPGRCNYISNVQRQDVITLLREQLSYFEEQSQPPKDESWNNQ